MNSLAYLSRQYDVLASTPPSTPTGERDQHDLLAASLRRGREQAPGKAKRTRSWVRDNLLQPTSAGAPSKRSKSSPSLAPAPSPPRKAQAAQSIQPPIPPTPAPPPPTPAPHSTASEQLAQWGLVRWRRTWAVRTWLLLWDALARAYQLLLRGRAASAPAIAVPQRLDDGEATSNESSEEEDVIVHRARPRPARPTAPPLTPGSGSGTDTEPPTPGTATDQETAAVALDLPRIKLPPASAAAGSSTLLPAPLANYLLSYSPPPSIPPTPPTGGAAPSKRTPFHLPKTLVLDLDETLIHSTSRPLHGGSTSGGGLLGLGWGRRGKPGGHMVEVVLGGRSTLYHVYKRPFVDYFLRKVSSWYTLVIFTASMQEYADPVIDWLDGGRGILARRLFRESCTQLPSGSYSKDLSVVEADLARVCLVDNSPASYSINAANGIPIEGWTHDQNDEALLDLLPFLDSLRFTSDVRRVLGIRGFQ